MGDKNISLQDARIAAGVSLAKAAALADVSEPTAKIFELEPTAVRNLFKRAALHHVYQGFRESAATSRIVTLSRRF